MHRMGSYFDNAQTPQPKSILSLPPPPTPPPTSSIPKTPSVTSSEVSRRNARYFHDDLRPAQRPVSRQAIGLGSRPAETADRRRTNLLRLRHEENDLKQIHALNRRLASLTIADMSPKLALKRILLLHERGEHRDAASFLRRISAATFRHLVDDLPIEKFLEAMPGSMALLEAVFAKIYLSDVGGTGQYMGPAQARVLVKDDKFSPEVVVWQVVYFFSNRGAPDISSDRPNSDTVCGPWVSTCKRLLSVLMTAEPRVLRLVAERTRALSKAIEGLGQHGPVGTSDEALMNLPDALRTQFAIMHKKYGEALQKLETSHKPKNVLGKEHNPPIAQSHQRQLSLTMEQIQERLIKNKSLLNAVEPTLESQNLDILLEILQRRIDLDKEVLFQFTQLRRDCRKLSHGRRNGIPGGGSVAPLLLRCLKGCQQVLELMREVKEESTTTTFTSISNHSCRSQDTSLTVEAGEDAYHSDSDSSTVMMSGNSPFVPKTARYNFLQRSVRSGKRGPLRSAISAENLRLRSCSPQSHSQINIPRIANRSNNNSNIFYVTTTSNNRAMVVNQHQHSSSGVSSNNSSGGSSLTASPPDSDSSCNSSFHEEDHDRAGGTNQPRSIVRVGPDGSASVVINSSGMILNGTGSGGSSLVLDGSACSTNSASRGCMRNRKFKKEIGMTIGPAGDISNRCLKCENPTATKYHGHKCTRSRSSEECHDSLIRRGKENEEVARLKNELKLLSTDLDRARRTIVELKCEQERLNEVQSVVSESTAMIYDVNSGDKRPAKLIRSFGDLYSIGRLETLDDLDSITELKDADELKNKLLFSVVVLSFRAASNLLERVRDQIKRLLQLNRLSLNHNGPNCATAAKEMEVATNNFLRRTCEHFDLSKNVEEVTSQIWATLYDYPCLKKSAELINYVESCVRIAWGLVNQVPEYVIEYDTRVFQSDLHVRFHEADHDSDAIKTYLWPALREGKTGPCVYKAVVIT